MANEPLRRQVESHPYPLVFATISGAHLYGFPSPDSDFDLRGAHLLPLEEVVGLKAGRETVEESGVEDGIEIDLVTHDAKKFFGLILKKNGYVLEQKSRSCPELTLDFTRANTGDSWQNWRLHPRTPIFPNCRAERMHSTTYLCVSGCRNVEHVRRSAI
jgi:hypothetical protein